MGLLAAAAVRADGAELPRGFWAAVRVWLDKPQVANRRLCGAAIEAEAALLLGEDGDASPLLGSGEEAAGGAELSWLWREVRGDLLGFLAVRPGLELRVVLRALLPRLRPAGLPAPPVRELVVQGGSCGRLSSVMLENVTKIAEVEMLRGMAIYVCNGTVTFLPLEENSEGKYRIKKRNVYQVQLTHIKDEEWSVSIIAPSSEDWFSDGITYPKLSWLGDVLLSKLAKWSVERKCSAFRSTLSLIPVAKYCKVYQDLKEKYKEMVKILWEEERKTKGLAKKQSFVDLGCGNGLLVHILSNEGHLGRGIDVRRRKIWDMFGPETHLEVLCKSVHYPSCRSSYSCRYFLLPCCFFDFHGKYSRRQSKKTQYREYLDFIADVGFVCGFHVEEDCLRIPSTKRVCLIGKSRTYPPTECSLVDEQITQFIRNRQTGAAVAPDREDGFNHNNHNYHSDVCKEVSSELPENMMETASRIWMPGFQPREKVEQTRNCAALPRDFVDDVVLSVANLLLNAVPTKSSSNMHGENMNTWNQGESLSLKEVAEHLNKETLKRLKSECGGLQTLLKNNHQVFEVLDGRVHIRDWRKEKPSRKTKPEVKRCLSAEAFKTRLCWFFIHHPDGCSLPSESCPYAHGTEELRQSQAIKKKKHIS
ncbi:hypothetical protein ASZ78_015671 [Callipepla squamata]|uniref:tRNA (uracil-O(2)-)-methyltransferase n=1 Tax=Callipepla squamata TaxID=9009 RepID=A0A226N458_CALSU|nr:hypothetical protein ASZ78_015671 [Callipepla squamata]